MPCEIHEVPRRRKNVLGAARDFEAGFRQHDVAGPPLDQRDADVLFKLADLHGEGRLGHRALLGGAAEVPVAGERREITQLTQRDHADKLSLSRHRTQYD